MNNQIPLAGVRNELGKLFTPYTRELGSGITDALRNRNLAFEKGPGEDLPIKYSILRPNTPIKEWDPLTRMWNAVSPVSFNLDYNEAQEFLFRSGYDSRLSTYFSPGPNSVNLSDAPRIRSLYQKAIGNQNLEKDLIKLSKDKKAIESLLQMEKDIRDGNRAAFEAGDYYHNRMINKLFTRARKKGWLEIKGNPLVESLIQEQKNKQITRNRKTAQTSNITPLLRIYK